MKSIVFYVIINLKERGFFMVTKHEQITNELNKRIYAGVYKTSKPLPNQNQLAKEFNVSRMTIKKALDTLSNEGLLYSKRGAGTFIRKTTKNNRISLPFNVHAGLSKALPTQIKSSAVLFNVIFPDDELAEKLDLKLSDPIYDILRLRLVDDEPFVLEHTYMPVNLIPGITPEILKKSVYSYIEDELKLPIGDAFRQITAEKAQENDIEFLNVKPNDPILQINQIVFLEDGRPFEFSISHHPYNKHAYTIFDRKKKQ